MKLKTGVDPIVVQNIRYQARRLKLFECFTHETHEDLEQELFCEIWTYSLIHKGRDIFKDETNGIRKISEHVRYLSNIVLNLKPIVLNRIEVRRVSGQI